MCNPTNRLTIFTLAAALLLLPTGLNAAVPAPIAPEIVSPGEIDVAVEVATACPTFSWTPVPGAASVELVVYDLPEGVESGALPSDPVLSRELPGGASTWTPSAAECLAGGHGYAWSVGAQTDGKAMVWSDIRVFQVSEPALSELEQVLERVLSRFVEQKRLDEATAAAIQADPSQILGPPRLGVEDATPLASAPILAAADSIAIQGAATGTLDSELTWGVVGTTEAGAENSAGVLGISDSISSANKKYGVLGVSADSNLESAGVGGQGKTGVVGVGDTSKNGIGVIGIASDTLTVAGAGIGVKVGVVGIGDDIGVQGRVDSATGVAGDFRNLLGKGLVVQGGGGQADIRMVTGLVDVMSGELTLGAGDKFVGTFAGDGAELTGVDATNTQTLDNLASTQFLRSDADDVYEGGKTLTIAGTLGFDAGGIFDATAMTGSGQFRLPTCMDCVTGGGIDSGLDADKLDGIQSTGYARLGIGNAGTLSITDGTESDNKDTGSIVTDGGLGVEKNISIGGKVRLRSGDLFSNETPEEILLEEGGGQNALLINLRDVNGGVVLKGDNEATGGHPGVRFTVQAEEAVNDGNRGGDLFLTAGTGGGGNSIGGTVEIIGGTGTGTSQGGDIVLQPGTTDTGAAGRVKIKGTDIDLNSSPSNNLAVSIVARQSSVANGTILYDPADTGLPVTAPAWNITPSLDLSSTINLVLPSTGISGAGTGSGLNADLLDNKSAGAFLSLPLSEDLVFSNLELLGNFIDDDPSQEVEFDERSIDGVITFAENTTNPDPGPTEPIKMLSIDFRNSAEVVLSTDTNDATAHTGAALSIVAEDAVSTGAGGNLSMTAGKGGVNTQGGDLSVTAGRALSESESANTEGRGGDISLTAGTGGGMQRGGSISITGGAGDSAEAGDGGDITLSAGDGSGSTGTTGGSVILDPGSGVSAGQVEITSVRVVLDSDSVLDADVDIVANQAVDGDGTLRYDASSNEWQISNDGGAFNGIVDAARAINTASGTSGLTGGGDLSVDRDLSVDIGNLSEDMNPMASANFVMTFDSTGGGSLNKVALDNLPTGSSGVTGAANLASGIEVFKNKTSGTLNFRTFSTGSNRATVVLGGMGNNEVVIDVSESDIDHDALSGFVADEHIDWTVSSAGTIDASNYVDDDVPESGDFGNATELTTTGAVQATHSGSAHHSVYTPNAQVVSDYAANQVLTTDWDFGGGGLEIENGTTPPACTEGQIFLDTDATSGQQLLACESGAFVVQGDGGLGTEANDLETDDPPNVLDTEVYIGTGTGTGAWAALGGEATMTNTGAVTIATSHSGSAHHSIFTPTDIDTDYGTEVLTVDWDFGGGGIEIENGPTPPACTEGQLFMDTDATSGQRLMACEGTSFKVQGAPLDDQDATSDDGTPSVAGISVLVLTGYTTATDITDLDDGAGGQCVVLVGGGNTANPIVKDAGSLRLAGDWTAADDATLTLCRAGTTWFESTRAAA